MGLGGISGDSMVPMLRPGFLKLSSGSWDKRGWCPPLAWRKLSGTMGSPPGGRVWDRYPLVTRALPSWPAPILGLEDVWVWVSFPNESIKPLQEPCTIFCRIWDFKNEKYINPCEWMDVYKRLIVLIESPVWSFRKVLVQSLDKFWKSKITWMGKLLGNETLISVNNFM